YDTYTPDSVIVLEEYRTQTLCACKNALKIAASSGDQICVYTFYPEGGGGLGSFRHRKNLPGHWARSVLATGETANVDRMCFLPNFWLVTLSADGVVRIYDDRHEISSFQAELGCIYAHPFLNIFAIVGQRLKMYEVACDGPANTAGCASWRPFSCDARVVFSNTRHTQPPGAVRKIYSGDIPISVNDCEFSADGRFFITGDDRGVIRAYSVCAPIHPPQQQFFPQDLDVSSRQTDTIGTNSPFGMTFDANMNINVNWKAQNYTIRSKRMCLQVELEELAAQHLLKDKLDQNTFYNLYLATEDGPATQSSSSEDDETWDEAMSTEESSTRTESEDILTEESEQMRGLRRVIESSEDEDEPVFNMRQRPLRRTAIRSIVIKGDDSDGGMDSRDKPIEGEEEIRGRPIRQSSVLNSMHNPSSLSNNNPRRRPIRQASVLNGNINYALEATLGAINDERDTSRDVSESSESSTTNSATATTRSTASTANSTTATKHKIQLRRTVLTESISSESDHGIDPQFEETLLAYAKKWLRSFFVYKNDKIYFCAEAYETFASLERRIFPDGPGPLPATGNHT
ncbi:MAG: hypothetical protein QRY16_21880, partial [Enterobacterales bacterium endosymbiont of Blomia tropicalis]|uniref:hypothetical protein n=1 Tax=Mixta mediterraneensis TaxID=2758443 RepID=UPI0025A907D5